MKAHISKRKNESGEPVILIKGGMTINSAAELKNAIMAEIENVENINFDLSGIDDIDTAGIQLLLSARRGIGTEKKIIKFRNPSIEITRISDLYGLTL
jgi:anti-sigma B factor antagonist